MKFELLPKPWWVKKNAMLWLLGYIVAVLVVLGLISKTQPSGFAYVAFSIACWVFILTIVAGYFWASASERAYPQWERDRARRLDADIRARVGEEFYPMNIADMLIRREVVPMTGRRGDYVYHFRRGVFTVQKVEWTRRFPEHPDDSTSAQM